MGRNQQIDAYNSLCSVLNRPPGYAGGYFLPVCYWENLFSRKQIFDKAYKNGIADTTHSQQRKV